MSCARLLARAAGCRRLASTSVAAAPPQSPNTPRIGRRRAPEEHKKAPIVGSQVPDDSALAKAVVYPALLRPYVEKTVGTSATEEDDPFGMEKLVTLEDMFAARLHLGHKVGTLHENMRWALYGERLGVCVFDLDVTRRHLVQALKFVARLASHGGMFLFVGSQKELQLDVERTAQACRQFAHVRRWQQGTLTNVAQLAGGGSPVRLPDCIILTTALSVVQESHPALVEAAKMTIPTVALVDSNADPAYVTYLIPANDDTPRAVRYALALFQEAILRGRKAADLDVGGEGPARRRLDDVDKQ